MTNHHKAKQLSILISDLAVTKELEKQAVLQRRNVEQAILDHPEVITQISDEGTASFGQLVIQTGYTRTWNQGMLLDLQDEVKDEYWPFKAEFKEDRKATRVFGDRFPDLWKRLSTALTLKPKKPQLFIREVKQ